MALTPEQQNQLKALLDAGVLTQAEYDAKLNPVEKWSTSKFLSGMFNVFHLSKWGKDIHDVFNLRKIIIYLLIVGAVFGWGYVRGLANKPIHIDSLQGKEVVVEISKDEFLHIHKDGTVHIHDAQGRTLKTITTKDIPALQAALKPIGFQLNPIVVGGYGVAGAGKSGPELGAGVSWFKFYRFEADSFLTTKGIYPIGVSYRLQSIGKGNTSVGLAAGKGYSGDNRILGYLRWEF
jgi:hypothetical protein